MFAFGRNWQSFLKNHLTPERIEEAVSSIRNFCPEGFLRGRTFVDVGCGSGLFSLAAFRLGASRILSFDVDPDSVACCEWLRKNAGDPEDWQISRGSILDPEFVASLGSFDLVYSWGVLHHTGEMWRAVDNAASLVAPSGLFYLAIYNKEERFRIHRDGRIGSSRFWLVEKKIYSSLPWAVQNGIDYVVMALAIFVYCATFRNPVAQIRNHKSLRGMSWRIDLKDWLGGYPYEFASVDEVTRFLAKRDFELLNLDEKGGLVNNEFLFRARGDAKTLSRPPA